eukprot:gene8263-9146_t
MNACESNNKDKNEEPRTESLQPCCSSQSDDNQTFEPVVEQLCLSGPNEGTDTEPERRTESLQHSPEIANVTVDYDSDVSVEIIERPKKPVPVIFISDSEDDSRQTIDAVPTINNAILSHFLDKGKSSADQQNSTSFDVEIESGRRFYYRSTSIPGNRHRNNFERQRRYAASRIGRRSNASSWGQSSWGHSAATLDRRKLIYRRGMVIKDIKYHGGRARYRDISLKFIKDNPATVHRYVPWILRDLNVLLENRTQNVSFVLHLILSLLTRISMESPEFHSQLEPFLLNNTSQFIREFVSFATSPYDMRGYDDNVVYDIPSALSSATQSTSGASSLVSPRSVFADNMTSFEDRLMEERFATENLEPSPPLARSHESSSDDESAVINVEKNSDSDSDSELELTRVIHTQSRSSTRLKLLTYHKNRKERKRSSGRHEVPFELQQSSHKSKRSKSGAEYERSYDNTRTRLSSSSSHSTGGEVLSPSYPLVRQPGSLGYSYSQQSFNGSNQKSSTRRREYDSSSSTSSSYRKLQRSGRMESSSRYGRGCNDDRTSKRSRSRSPRLRRSHKSGSRDMRVRDRSTSSSSRTRKSKNRRRSPTDSEYSKSPSSTDRSRRSRQYPISHEGRSKRSSLCESPRRGKVDKRQKSLAEEMLQARSSSRHKSKERSRSSHASEKSTKRRVYLNHEELGSSSTLYGHKPFQVTSDSEESGRSVASRPQQRLHSVVIRCSDEQVDDESVAGKKSKKSKRHKHKKRTRKESETRDDFVNVVESIIEKIDEEENKSNQSKRERIIPSKEDTVDPWETNVRCAPALADKSDIKVGHDEMFNEDQRQYDKEYQKSTEEVSDANMEMQITNGIVEEGMMSPVIAETFDQGMKEDISTASSKKVPGSDLSIPDLLLDVKGVDHVIATSSIARTREDARIETMPSSGVNECEFDRQNDCDEVSDANLHRNNSEITKAGEHLTSDGPLLETERTGQTIEHDKQFASSKRKIKIVSKLKQ